MASSLTGQRLTSNLRVKMFHHDPADATVATKVPAVWRSLAGIRSILAGVLVGSAHAMVTFKIFAGTDATGTGATEVVVNAAPTVADALGDVLYVEALIEQIKDVLPGATHYAAEIDMNNSAGVAVLVLIEDLDRSYRNLTADQIA